MMSSLRIPREKGVPPMSVRLWLPQGTPRGVIQILHGMAEHIDRYDFMARTLSEKGYLVAGHNHRGHGPEWPKESLGSFAPKDGWQAILKDARLVTRRIKALAPAGTPFILLGHSMGSFLAREYALTWPGELDALILSGTGDYARAVTRAGKAVAALCPGDKPARLVDRIAFSGNNKAFKPNRTPFDWLSRDEKQVDQYVADPLCGFLFTGQAYRDFFDGLLKLTYPERLQKLGKDMPVLLISGEQDPVGAMGVGVKKVARSLTDAGLKNVTCTLYPGARHELFNETNRAEVLEDLCSWLNQFFPEDA